MDKYGYSDNSRVCHSLRPIIDRIIENMPDNAIFVESGCYLGITTAHFIEKLLASKKSFKYYCIDNWKFDNVPDKYVDNLLEFKQNLGELIQYATIIVDDAINAIQLFQDNSVYFCFLDDSHKYQHVTKQISDWLPKMAENSFLAGDDYYDNEVYLAVHDHFNDSDIENLNNNAGFLIVNPKVKIKNAKQ